MSWRRDMECDVKDSTRSCHGKWKGDGNSLRKKRLKSKHRRGIALIWTALVIIVMVGMAGLAIDYGKVVVNLHQMHNGADAAALAGAQIVRYSIPETVIARTYEIGSYNGADRLPIILDTTLQGTPDLRGDEEIILGRWINQERKFYPGLLSPNAVRVIVYRKDGLGERAPGLMLLWGPLFGTERVDASRYATARSLISSGAAIICLAPEPDWTHAPTGLWLHGTGDVDLSGVDFYTNLGIVGDVQVNATENSNGPWQGMRADGNVLIAANEINVVGATNPPVTEPEDWAGFFTDPTLPASVTGATATDPGAPHVDDPLRFEPQPQVLPIPNDRNGNPYTYTITSETVGTLGEVVLDPTTGAPTNVKVLTLDPGYYPGGISLSSGSWTDPVSGVTYQIELVLRTGTTVDNSAYALGGGSSGKSGLVMTGGSISGEGVTLFVTGAHAGAPAGTQYGETYLGGNASITLTPPGDVHLLNGARQIEGAPGVSIWQDRGNTNEATIIGTNDFNLSGTLYFPSNHTELGGTGFQAGNQLITGSLDLHGTGDMSIGYDGRGRIIAKQSILVE